MILEVREMIYNVPLIPQDTDMSCWAASIAMILSWRDGTRYDPKMIAENVGGTNYMPQYVEGGGGLSSSDQYILKEWGFVAELPKCYTQTFILCLLIERGPLWCATWTRNGPHIRVISGMLGTDLFINDPAPPGVGERYQAPFENIFGLQELLGRQEFAETSPVYLAHLR